MFRSEILIWPKKSNLKINFFSSSKIFYINKYNSSFTVSFQCCYATQHSFNLEFSFKLKIDPKASTFKKLEETQKINGNFVYKNRDSRSDCNNYQGISLLAIAGKAFARVILPWLQKLAKKYMLTLYVDLSLNNLPQTWYYL